MAVGFNLESDNNGFEEGYAAAKRESKEEVLALKEKVDRLEKKVKSLNKKIRRIQDRFIK